MHFGLLGPFEVTYAGENLDLGRPKQRVVLATMLLNANRVVSLDRFADVLWADGVVTSPGSLPVYIANLRRLLEPERPARTPPQRILTRPPGYLLRVDAGEYDVADFQRLATEGNRYLAEKRPRAARQALGEALSLWRGRAMEEFPFAELESLRLDGLRVAATEDRIEADLALGAHTAVVAELEGLIQEFGLRERLVALLMTALYRSGRQGEALRAYSTARDHLRRALGVDPGPDLRRLEAEILDQSPALDWYPPPEESAPLQIGSQSQAPVANPSTGFFGRVAELSALQHALVAQGGAPGGIALVSGEPGIGKTRLVLEAVSRAAGAGSVVVWGRCEEGDGAAPFLPWVQIIRSLLEGPDPGSVKAALGRHGAEISQIVPEVADLTGDMAPPPPADPATARRRLLDAVVGLVSDLSRHQPLVVFIDDLHWADPPSLQLTEQVARQLPGSRARLVATYRDVDPAPDARFTETLATLARLPGLLQMTLQGLTEDEVSQFIAHEAGVEPAAGVVAAVWARAAGNPFFVSQLTRLLVAEKALTESAAAAPGVPWAVRQVVARRLARLPAATTQLLTVAAVAGTEFDLRVAALAAGVDLDPALDLIDVAMAAGVVRQILRAPERYEFSHALVQETVYADASQLRRARLHGLVADALEQVSGTSAAATEIAHHLYQAVPVTGPARAVAAALRASAAAQAALAYEVAQEHLHRALALAATMPAGRERDSHELDVQNQLAALLTLVKGVAVPETAAAWTRATELSQAVDDRRRLLPSLWGLLSFSWASGDLEGARTLGEHLLSLGRASSEPVVTAAAHLGLGSVALCAGDLKEGIRQLEAGKKLADGVADDLIADVTYADLRVQVDSWLAMARNLQGRHDTGRDLADGALGRARALGDPFTMAIGLAFAVFARLLSGETDETRQLSEELLEHAERYQMPDFAFHGRVTCLWALARSGAPKSEVIPRLDALPPASAAGIRPWRPFWLALLADVSLRIDHRDRARRLIDEAYAEVKAMGASFSVETLSRLRTELELPPD